MSDSTAGVRVMIVGKRFELPYADTLHLDRTADLIGEIARFQPDVIVTSQFHPGALKTFAFDVRKRWIHVPEDAKPDDVIHAIENCYRSNLWTEHPGQKGNPLVSVYTPTHNTGGYLAETWRSLLDQSYKNWEWVVIDDYSTDGTWERLLEYVKDDPRIRPFRSGKPLRKIGLVKDAATRLALGEFLVELDHDDMLTDFALDEIVKAFKADPDAGMVYSNCACFFEDGSPHRFPFPHFQDKYRETEYRGKKWLECRAFDIYGRYGPRWWERNAYWLTVGPNHVRAYRAETLRKLGGYNRNLPVADDWDLFSRFFLASKCLHVDKMLYLYRYLDGFANTTFARNKSIQDHLKLGQQHRAVEFERYDKEHPDPTRLAPQKPFDNPAISGMVSIVLATRGRPDNLRRMVESAFLTAKEPSLVEVVAFVDEDDQSTKNALEALAKDRPVRFVAGPRGKLSHAYNAAARLARGEILHGSADDVIYRTQGWDSIARSEFAKQPDGILMVYGKDGQHDEKVPTHPFLGRAWVEAVGYFQPPYFSGWYSDNWLGDLATKVARKVYAPELMIEHMHHSAGKAPLDDTYMSMATRSPSEHGLLEKLAPQREEDSRKLRAAFRTTRDISYVVPTVIPGPLLLRCLRSIRKWSPGSEVVLIAQGCEISSEIEELADKVVRLPANIRWSSGCNRGVMEATKTFLCLLNDDAEFVDETPVRLLRAITLTCPIVAPYSDRAKPPQGDIPYERCPAESVHPEAVVGVCLMMPVEAYRELGGLDPRLDTYDDDDLCLRLRRMMMGCTVVGGAWIRHERHASFSALGEDVGSVMRKNERIFRRKNPRIRVVAIAKDEEKAIDGFFEQFKRLTQDWCLLDTGSTDRTVEFAKGLGVRVERGELRDFAQARNEALFRFGKGADWVIMLDPDERLDQRTLNSLEETLFSATADILLAPLDAVYPDGSRKEFVPKSFIHRVKPGIEWVFKVHEKLIGSDRQALIRNAKIEHLIALHEDGRRQKAAGLYDRLMKEEPYFTNPAFKAEILKKWPILDYDRMDDERIDKIHAGPLVSVIIPTYRRPELLERAVKSALRQDYANLEVVVIGDADPDFRPPDGARALNLSQNHGTGGAAPRNVGISMAAGEWIAYLDDDNFWEPDHVSSVMAAIATSRAAFGFSSMSVDGKDLGFTEPKQGGIDTSCVIHHRDLIRKHGFWKDRVAGGYAHDWELFSRWVKAGEKWSATKKPSVIYNADTCGQPDFIRKMAARCVKA